MLEVDFSKLVDKGDNEEVQRRAQKHMFNDGVVMPQAYGPATSHAIAATTNPGQYMASWDRLNWFEKNLSIGTTGGLQLEQQYRVGQVSKALDEYVNPQDILTQDDEDVVRMLVGEKGAQQAKERLSEAQQVYARQNLLNEYKEFETTSKQLASQPKPKGIEAVVKAQDEDTGFFDNLSEGASALANSPDWGWSVAYLAGTSTINNLPFLLAGAGLGKALHLGGASAMKAALSRAGAAGIGSAQLEYNASLADAMASAGVTQDSPTFVNDLKQSLDGTRSKAALHAAGVGAFDAASALIAPVNMNPLRMLKKTWLPANPGRVAKFLGRGVNGAASMAGQTVVQGALGGAGEVAGSWLADEPINAADVLFEMLGEAGGAPVDVGVAVWSAGTEKIRKKAQAAIAHEGLSLMEKVTDAVNVLSAQLGDNQAVGEWAKNLTEKTRFFAFAQDLVDHGQVEALEKVDPELAQKVRTEAEQKQTVEISPEEIVRVATKDKALAQEIVKDSRMTVDGMSGREAENYLANEKQHDEARIEELIKKVRPTVELRKEAKVITDEIVENLIQSGVRSDLAQLYVKPWEMYLVHRAKQFGISPKQVADRIGLKVERVNEGRSGARARAFAQPFTQGIHWNMGVKYTDPNTKVRVIRVKKTKALTRDALKAQLVRTMANGIKNKDSGFVLTASGNDIGKWLQYKGEPSKQKVFLISQIVEDVGDLLAEMKLIESHADSKQRQKGIHNFTVGINFDGNTYRLLVTAKDYFGGKEDRVAAHAVSGTKLKAEIRALSIEEVRENPVAKRVVATGGHVDPKDLGENHQTVPDPLTTVRTISLSRLMGGVKPYKRADGKGYFDSVDSKEYEKGGRYYTDEDNSFNQDVILDEWAKWEPKTTKSGKILGAPEWVTNRRKLLKMRKLLEQLAREGESGRFWYELTARVVWSFVGGDVKLADKFCQLLAIYSPQTGIGPNVIFAIRAYVHWKNGLPPETLHVKTGKMDQDARNVLYENKDWAGRKTNTFYCNIMYEIVMQEMEAAQSAGIDTESILSSRATIDLWMLRAFGYENDVASDDKGQGKYSFSENEIRRLTAQFNANLHEGEKPWTPHQVQAAIWTAIKTRYEMPEVKRLTNEKSAKEKLIKKIGKKYSFEHMSAEQTRAHHAIWRKFAMKPTSEVVKTLAKENGRSFADEIVRLTQVVTWEAIPTTTLGYEINNASQAVKRKFSEEVASLFIDTNGHNVLAKSLGIHLSSSVPGDGGYSGAITPNTLTRLLPASVQGQKGVSREEARTYARSLQYICLQDAVPFFRFENKMLSAMERKNQRFKVKNKNGRIIKTFETQKEAQAFADKKKDKGYTVEGGPLAQAVVFKFKKILSDNDKGEFLDKLIKVLGEKIGYTRTGVDEITVVNFRDDKTHLPYIVSDEIFLERLASLDIDSELLYAQKIWTEGEYGYEHDWSADQGGEAILKLLEGNDADQNSRSNTGKFTGIATRPDLKQSLVRWRLHYKALLEKYSGENLRIIEEELQKNQNSQEVTTDALAQDRRGTYTPSNTSTNTHGMGGVITLMENADKSTFLHESAHAWLDADTMLALALADKVTAGQELTAGEQEFLRTLGAFFQWGQREGVIDLGVTDDLDTVLSAALTWSSMSVDEQRGMHELFAEGFEAYILDGHAPTPEVRSIFARFTKWLLDVYAAATNRPTPLSPEVAKLYDLLFISEQEARDAETRAGIEAMFAENDEKLKMTPQERAEYDKLAEDADSEAAGLIRTTVAGVMKMFTRVRSQTARRIRREHQQRVKDVVEALEREPRYIALNLLLKPFREPLTNKRTKYKLSEEKLRAEGFDQATIDALKRKGLVYQPELMRGNYQLLSASELAGMSVGPENIDLKKAPAKLIGQLLETEDVNTEAAGIVAAEVMQETGRSPEEHTQLESDLAAHNATRERLLNAEFNVLARVLGKPSLLLKAAKDFALTKLNGMRISDIMPYVFVQAEQRYAKRALEAYRKGDFNKALEYKRGQLINFQMARLSLQVLSRIKKANRRVKRAAKSKTLYKPYQRLLVELARRHQFGGKLVDRSVGTEENLAAALRELEDEGVPIEGLREALIDNTPVSEMTLEKADEFFQILLELEHVSRERERMNREADRDRVDNKIQEGKKALSEAARAQGLERKRLSAPLTTKERVRTNLKAFFTTHLKVQTLCRIFDRNKDNGFFWNLFIRTANERADFETELGMQFTKRLDEILTPIFGTKGMFTQDVRQIGGKPMSKGQRFAAALNLGNLSNKERLVNGDPKFWTQETIDELCSSLTVAEWEAVQKIWDLFESLRPQIAEKQKRVYGTEPKWIDPLPQTVSAQDGVVHLKGGYYPVVYDPYSSAKGQSVEEAKLAEQSMKGAFQASTTNRSFTKSRVKKNVVGPLRLDMSALYSGLNDVIHDLAWHEWLIEVNRLLKGVHGNDSGLLSDIRDIYGYESAQAFKQWVEDIAQGDRMGPDATAARFMRWFSGRVGASTMGWNVMSAFIQLTGIGYAIPRCGAKNVMSALRRYISDPVAAHEMIDAASPRMRARARTMNKQIAEVKNRIEGNQKNPFLTYAYLLIVAVQNVVDAITWMASFEKSMKDPAVLQSNDPEALAAAIADQDVTDTQGSGITSDEARVERDTSGVWPLFTIFYSFMNSALNQIYAIQKGEENRRKKAAQLMWLAIVMPVAETFIRGAMKVDLDDDDDDDDESMVVRTLRKGVGSVASFNLGLFVGLRELSYPVENWIEGNRIYPYAGPAGMRNVAATTDIMRTVNDPTSWRFVNAVIGAAGLTFGLPSAQIKRTIKGIRAIESEQATDLDAIAAPVFGVQGRIKE